ncbi:HigA family addiction module antitoxin [Pseudoramibacter sp.]|jgi:addiction module HigA family antidote|uniref:HigA family addiction module antitoxin n=1 Tax=Pseudoramibacter sp. TaxID=2034862 RepID=UPI0025F7D707|nr:HigA family addiction module antitoxin [Pseudoramibacter sp.]MCH4072334.1 HigA family addiction module antitoxin [Pseudoramibacter sp.]MCH4106105.1 HigA family addiction module antitoxin [Pseudoramibacter sp.]
MNENRIETPTVGEILKEEFMEPLGLSAYKLAQDIHVPVSRIQDILHNRRKVTADTSLRLAKLFGVSDRYFLNLQDDIDIRNLKQKMQDEINGIETLQYA